MKAPPAHLCFVVHRYGHEVTGGAETLCREVASRLSGHYTITVLTTCARDYLTWRNQFPPGPSREGPLRIIRLPVSRTRRVRSFGRFSKKIYNKSHSMSNEMLWMEKQGPDSPLLLKYIDDHRDEYDLWVFFTYLYATTFFGLPKVAGKSLLVPMAHPEEPLELAIFDYLFHLPRGMIFNTPEEKDLVHRRFNCSYIPSTVAGMGINPPRPDDKFTLPAEDFPKAYLLYTGRLDVQKGLDDLFAYFSRYTEKHPQHGLNLLLAGDRKMDLPSSPRIKYLGYLSESVKSAALAGCLAAVTPSPHESLSIAALEAWSHGKPVIANGHSEVLAGQCRRSQGGLTYRSYEDFETALNRLLEEDILKEDLGRAGSAFVSEHYRWEVIESHYLSFLGKILSMTGQKKNSDGRA